MQIVSSPSFSELTTLRLGGRGLALVSLQALAELEQVARFAEREGGAVLPLGRGSNLLAVDGELPLVPVRWQPALPDRLTPEQQSDGTLILNVSANLPLPRLVARTAALGFAELAGLAGIPGEVGGAMAMNAGSHGAEFARIVRRCTVFTPEHGLLRLENGTGFTPAYRQTIFHVVASWMLILEVELQFCKSDQRSASVSENLLGRVGEYIRNKAAVQPVRSHSAGCVFKNPDPEASGGRSAGKLLEEAGFRGINLGGVGFSVMHANFLVNHGGGTATQALELLDKARTTVARLSGVSLEPEVRILSC